MYYFLSLICGILISLMVAFNGSLSQQYGLYASTFFIHISGLVFISALVLAKREHPFAKRHRWFLYLGGAIGVTTILFNNFAFARISVSALLALSLFGQGLAGLIIDQYGWLGMPKHPFRKQRLVGLTLTLCGVAVMMDRFDFVAILLTVISGVNVVVARTLNAKLAEYTSVRISTFYNYFVGVAVSIPILFILGRNDAAFSGLVISQDFYIYLGGFLGACTVLISNILVSKIPSVYLSLLLFVGQVFTGVVIDAVISQSFSPHIFIGGILVATGLCADLILDRKNRGKPV